MLTAWLRTALCAICLGLMCLGLATLPAKAQQAGSAAQSGGDQKPAARSPAKSGQTAGKAAPQPQSHSGQKPIGFISMVGEGITIKKVGIMVFGNEEKTFPGDVWKVDDRVTTVVAGLLKKNFRVKRIAVPPGTLKRFNGGSFFLKSYEDEFTAFVAGLVKGERCDYYFVVSNAHSPLGSTNQSLGGLGVVQWGSIVGPHQYVYALSFLNVYDAQMKPLRTEKATIGQDTFFEPIKGPFQKLEDGSLLPENVDAAFADPRTKQLVMGLLEKSLTVSVPRMFAAE